MQGIGAAMIFRHGNCDPDLCISSGERGKALGITIAGLFRAFSGPVISGSWYRISDGEVFLFRIFPWTDIIVLPSMESERWVADARGEKLDITVLEFTASHLLWWCMVSRCCRRRWGWCWLFWHHRNCDFHQLGAEGKSSCSWYEPFRGNTVFTFSVPGSTYQLQCNICGIILLAFTCSISRSDSAGCGFDPCSQPMSWLFFTSCRRLSDRIEPGRSPL